MKNDFAAVYKESTDAFLLLARSLSESDLDVADQEGWTPRQVIHHVADSEAQSYARLRRLVAEPGTTIQGYDEAKWAENKDLSYKVIEVSHSIAVIAAVRESSYLLLKRLSADTLINAGVHSESGAYSVRDWIETYTRHPLEHAEQIRKQLKTNSSS
jgi:DinB superfamily